MLEPMLRIEVISVELENYEVKWTFELKGDY